MINLRPKLFRKFYRLNQYIRANKIRVIDEKGKQIGVMPVNEALVQAQKTGADLVEIAPKAQPPVCKIIDFKKFLFLEAKKNQKEKKKSKRGQLKEIRLTPFIAENDFNFRIKRAADFLKQKNKVKITIFFKGRQITKKNFGYELLKKAAEKLNSYGEIDTNPKFTGPLLEMILRPISKKNKNDKKNEIQNQKVITQKI